MWAAEPQSSDEEEKRRSRAGRYRLIRSRSVGVVVQETRIQVVYHGEKIGHTNDGGQFQTRDGGDPPGS